MIQKAKAMEKLDTDDVSFYFYYPHYISTHHTTASHCITITVYQHHHIITLYPYHHSVSISPLCIHIITVYPHTHTHTHTHTAPRVSSGEVGCPRRGRGAARTDPQGRHTHTPRDGVLPDGGRDGGLHHLSRSLSLSVLSLIHSFIYSFSLSFIHSLFLFDLSLSLFLY